MTKKQKRRVEKGGVVKLMEARRVHVYPYKKNEKMIRNKSIISWDVTNHLWLR